MSYFVLPSHCLLFIRWVTSVGEEGAVFLLSFTRVFVVSVRRRFLFLWVLGK